MAACPQWSQTRRAWFTPLGDLYFFSVQPKTDCISGSDMMIVKYPAFLGKGLLLYDAVTIRFVDGKRQMYLMHACQQGNSKPVWKQIVAPRLAAGIILNYQLIIHSRLRMRPLNMNRAKDITASRCETKGTVPARYFAQLGSIHGWRTFLCDRCSRGGACAPQAPKRWYSGERLTIQK